MIIEPATKEELKDFNTGLSTNFGDKKFWFEKKIRYIKLSQV